MKVPYGRRLLCVVAISTLISAAGCGPKSGHGFTLPDGDTERGKQTFVQLQCYVCHEVSGTELPAADPTLGPIVKLGGMTRRIQTYGELVTSIINPSHKVSPRFAQATAKDSDGEVVSPMVNNNDAMTVSQLIDLVAFLQSHYKLEPYQPTRYMH